MAKRVAILSDTQLPYVDWRALKAVVQFIGDTQPDEVIHIGDVMDFPQPSRWTKGSRHEFEGSIYADVEQAKAKFLGPLRDVYDGPVGFHEGNHDERPRVYLEKYAPALTQEGGPFNFENLLDFDGFGITKLPDFYDVAPGWITTHGHRGMISLSPLAGRTATNAAVRMGVSVIMGHTHRAGISSKTTGYAGNISKQLHGMEVGHLMNQKLAGYLKGGTGDWQKAFGLLTVDGRHVTPELALINNGKFTVDGHTWVI